MLFDKICRKTGSRIGWPSSPYQNGKVERFHGTFGPDFLDVAGPFTSIEAAQAAVDAWVVEYNWNGPHQALHDKLPVTPAERFAPVPDEQRGLLDLWLPALPSIRPVETTDTAVDSTRGAGPEQPSTPAPVGWAAARSSSTGWCPRRGT